MVVRMDSSMLLYLGGEDADLFLISFGARTPTCF